MDRGRLTTHPSSNQAPNGIAEVGQVSPRTGKSLGKKMPQDTESRIAGNFGTRRSTQFGLLLR